MSFDATLTAINHEIRFRKIILEAAAKVGCENLPTIAANRDELAELEQIRANLEAVQERVQVVK